ncbi:S8 family peptidase [Oscillospiraceae bacterium N12]|uniref:S8 family peptidase n=1 Tax=Jilunia laotingensis TaxID=2763675 RepID=A0A926F678_9BACT|nr:S8 family peptidase [Jilunia laotingensis]MBC8594740.1 S8 family peptidase [Jilunia laotingensis]
MKNSLLFFLLGISLSLVGYSQSKMSTNTSLLLMSLKHDTLSIENSKKIDKRFAVHKLGNERYVNAFIHLSDAGQAYSALEELGVKVNSKFTGVITASVPVNEIESIAALDCVTYIEIGTPVSGLMDNARAAMQADDVRLGVDLPHSFLGTGVIVGVVDLGIEYGHVNFWNYDRTELRVKRVWNQFDSTGIPPKGLHYGTELTSGDEILNAKYDTDSSLHGTHVAGIAAGADTINNKYYGIAGDADLAFVSYNGELDGWDNINICDGIKYLFDYADSANKPCVVNLSLGCSLGSHDGTSTFSRITDSMVGKGRIVVAAAGNSTGQKEHISKTFTPEIEDSLSTFLKFRMHHETQVDIWGDKGMRYTIRLFIYDDNKRKITKYFDILDASSETGNERVYTFSDSDKEGLEGQISIVSELNPINGKPHVLISTDLPVIKNYIGFTIRPVTAGKIDVWAESTKASLTNFDRVGYMEGGDQGTVSDLVCGDRVIAVGAYVTKNNYVDCDGRKYKSNQTIDGIASFSSLGPTSDGRIKPDVTAPGTTVISSVSSYFEYIPYDLVPIINKTNWNDQPYYYSAKQGTSMASPCVAGVVATWLQANNNLTPEDVKSILKKTSIQDSFTGRLPEDGSNTWGYGKLNAWEGVKECLKMNPEGIESETVKPVIILSNDSNGFNLLFTQSSDHTKISVFDINGRQIYDRQINGVGSGEEIPIRLEGVSSGLYIVKVQSRQSSLVLKMILK